MTVSTTANEAYVTWEGSADSYIVSCNGVTTTVTGNSTTLTGLTSATPYTMSLTADCGLDGTSNAVITYFMTACEDIVVFPYAESFESGLGCWISTTVSGSSNWTVNSTYNSSSSAPDGGSFAYLSSTSYGHVTTLTSPLFDLSGLTNPYISFFHIHQKWVSDQDKLYVYYKTSPTAAPVLLASYVDNITSWQLDSLALPSPSAEYQIIFEGHADYGYGIGLDQVRVYGENIVGPVITNPTVTTIAASPVTQTTATLNATITNPDNVTITLKGFEWKATNGGTYTQIAGTGTGNDFSAELTDLSPNMEITFRAFVAFSGQTAYGEELTFTTLEQGVEPCGTPTGLHTTNVENEAIAITWDADADVNGWNIRYRVQNGSWSSATATTNSYTITDLTGNTDYEIQVQADCGDGNLSDWSTAITVHTTNVGIENWLEKSVSLYPNPAREYIDIRVDGDLNVTMMEVYDVYGKLINTVNDIDNPTRINVNGLADGMYFVRVTTEKGAVTKTFVKR